jgi:hypothetical protein
MSSSITFSSHMSFFCLNNSLGNKWFNFKISFWIVYTIIPFSTCSLVRYLKPIMLEILLCSGPKVGAWFTYRLIFPTFLLSSLIFFHNALNVIWIIPSFNCRFCWCVCTHPINPMGICLLHYVPNNKHIESVTTLALGSWPKQRLARVRAKTEARESHLMLPRV